VAISSKDFVPLSHAKDHLAELAEDRLEREHAHLTLLDEAERALDDVDAGRTMSVEELRAKYGR
jgi:hypothetical protein